MMMKTEKKWSGRTRRLLEIIDMFSKGAMATTLGGLHLVLLYEAGLNSLLLHVLFSSPCDFVGNYLVITNNLRL